jgi:ribonuclease HI
VLRDENGLFVRASARWYDHCLDALTAEALACHDGLSMARHINAHKVWLETDSQEMLHLWQDGPNQRSSIEVIFAQIRDLSSVFEDFKFTYIARSCNEVAHTIAKQVTGDTRTGWWSCAPACVTNLMI